jgi:uncharacterized membrane protein
MKFQKEDEMKKILLAGILGDISLGIIFFIVKFFLTDFLPSIFSPLTSLFLSGREYLNIPAALVLIFIITMLIGLFLTRVPIFDFRKIPKDVEKGQGALVEFGPGAYYLAAVICSTTLTRIDGNSQKQFVLFCPSVPLPWTGLPVITVDAEKVILLKITFGEIYGTITSFGKNIPKNLYELKGQNGEKK